MHVDSQLKSHSRKGNLGMVQIEGPRVPFRSIGVEILWVQAARARVQAREHGVVVVQRSIAHRGQARWTGNSPEYFAKVAAAAAASAHDPLADYQTNRLHHHGETVGGPAFALASLVQHDQVAAAAAAGAHDLHADY